MSKIETLQNSLIYQMSLGSKELYHSNVWAWLIEQNHEFIKIFGFDDSYVRRAKRVGREEGDRDISIYLDDKDTGPVIVIENKLKSIPSTDQLKKYQEGLKERFHEGILTGIVLPTIVDDDNKVRDYPRWSFVNYQTISERILAILKTIKDGFSESNRSAIEEYCKDIAVMNEIVAEKASKTTKPFWDYDLDNLGLQDLINKVKASQFMRRFDEYLKQKSISFGPSFEHGHGFHNKKNTIDFRFVSKGEEKLRIGIQIEGDQFRRFAQLKDNDANNEKYGDIVFSAFKDIWFDGVFYGHRNDDSRRIKWPEMPEAGLETVLTHNYAQYRVKNDYCFVYQYAKLNDESFEYEPLIELIINNLILAKRLFDEYLANQTGE